MTISDKTRVAPHNMAINLSHSGGLERQHVTARSARDRQVHTLWAHGRWEKLAAILPDFCCNHPPLRYRGLSACTGLDEPKSDLPLLLQIWMRQPNIAMDFSLKRNPPRTAAPSSAIEIQPVDTRGRTSDFLRVPHTVFKDDPQWIPPLDLERRLHISTSRNPYFQHAEARLWVAYREGAPVGRISAQIDRLHLERYGDATGHFGFLDSVDDVLVFQQLLATAEQWLRSKGIVRALGPMSFSLWHETGLLVDGFDRPPSVLMGHAQPYYESHILRAGYRPIRDLIAYAYDCATPTPPTAARIIERSNRRSKIDIRPIRRGRKDINEEFAVIMDIINDSWSDNWGFVPMTAEEVHEFGSLLRMLTRPGDVAIAEYDGEPAAFILVMPNINEAISDLRGRLLPLGWAKLLLRLKWWRVRSMRMPLLGVRKKHHGSTTGAALALMLIEAVRSFNFENGAEFAELSWVLDDNTRIKHIIDLAGGQIYKRYRIFEKDIPAADR